MPPASILNWDTGCLTKQMLGSGLSWSAGQGVPVTYVAIGQSRLDGWINLVSRLRGQDNAYYCASETRRVWYYNNNASGLNRAIMRIRHSYYVSRSMSWNPSAMDSHTAQSSEEKNRSLNNHASRLHSANAVCSLEHVHLAQQAFLTCST